MGYGGPVWHASVSPSPYTIYTRETLLNLKTTLREKAFTALVGVGDGQREWEEYNETAKVFNLRRRLNLTEEGELGPAIDLRGTPEALQRFRMLEKVLPRSTALNSLIFEELRTNLSTGNFTP
jgi:hypothetical protein